MKLTRLLIVIAVAIVTALGASAQEKGTGALLQLKPENPDQPVVGKPTEPEKSVDNSQVFSTPEMPPAFPGGQAGLMKFLSSHVQYPAEAAEMRIQGRVVVTFIIEKDGSISNIKVVRGVSPALDAEAVRVVKSMPRWAPGEINGKPVRVTYNLPVTFRLT